MRWRRDDAHQLRAAHHGKILLQRVNAADQRVGQRVGGRERGEIGEHHFAHAHGVHHRLEEDALILDLRADHDEEAGDNEPGTVQQHAAHHGRQRQHLAQAGGGAAGGSKAVLAGKAAAEQPPAVQRISGQQMQHAQAGLHPHHAAQQVGGGDEGLVEEPYIAAGAQKRSGQHQRRGSVGQRTGQRHGKLPAALVGILLALGIGVGKQPADGQQQNRAQPQSQPRRHQQPRRLAHRDRRHQHEEQAQAARHAVRRR